MKRCALGFLIIAGLLAGTARAAEKKAPPPELDPKLCQQMVTYQPENVNGAEYKPGVDVHGKPVVEADINPRGGSLGTVSFNLTVDVAQYMGLQTPIGLQGDAVIGHIEVDREGHVTFNGQPLEGPAEATLRDLCAPKVPEPKSDSNKHNQ